MVSQLINSNIMYTLWCLLVTNKKHARWNGWKETIIDHHNVQSSPTKRLNKSKGKWEADWVSEESPSRSSMTICRWTEPEVTTMIDLYNWFINCCVVDSEQLIVIENVFLFTLLDLCQLCDYKELFGSSGEEDERSGGPPNHNHGSNRRCTVFDFGTLSWFFLFYFWCKVPPTWSSWQLFVMMMMRKQHLKNTSNSTSSSTSSSRQFLSLTSSADTLTPFIHHIWLLVDQTDWLWVQESNEKN